MIAICAAKEGQAVEIHVDDEGIDQLIHELKRMKGKAEDCHFFSEDWGTGDLDILEKSEDFGFPIVVHQLNLRSNYNVTARGNDE